MIIDERIRPKGGEEFVAAANIRGPARQISEQIKCLGGERDFRVPVPQAAVGDVQSETAERKRHA